MTFLICPACRRGPHEHYGNPTCTHPAFFSQELYEDATAAGTVLVDFGPVPLEWLAAAPAMLEESGKALDMLDALHFYSFTDEEPVQ